MKMVKSLLLGSAAGLVAVAGAQAADLPVKAKPVEYVKICSLYGAGYYYIPGTDICMKIGSYMRYQVSTGVGNNISFGPFAGQTSAAAASSGPFNNRMGVQDVAQRVRSIATFDTRQQTAYGTLRTYLLMGYTHDTVSQNPSPVSTVYMTRGFIQLAGFTFGKASSYFDFVSTAAVAYNAGFTHAPDTGDPGQLVAAYTAQFGNGVSATLSMEQSRRLPTVYTTLAVGGTYPGSGLGPLADNLGEGTAALGLASRPDFVGNLRVDQAWGSAQVSAAVHDVSAAYYGAGANAGVFETNGHPGDTWGWAVSGGLRLNAPMIAPGDFFQADVVYAEGATKYASNSPGGTGTSQYWSGQQFAFGFYEDAVFGGTATGLPAATNAFGNSIELTTAWSVFASYEHFWTPSLRTSIYGSYLDISHTANAVGLICGALGAAALQCNPDFRYWNVGSRTQWNVTKDMYFGVDVIYSKLETATINNGALFIPAAVSAPTAATGKSAAGPYQTADQDAVSVTWRVHRDIVP